MREGREGGRERERDHISSIYSFRVAGSPTKASRRPGRSGEPPAKSGQCNNLASIETV